MGAEAIEQARQLLPAWVGWAQPVVWVVGGYLISWLCASMAAWISLRPLRRAGEVSWIEHARLSFPARSVTAMLVFFLPFLVGVVASSAARNPLSRITTTVVTLLSVLVSWVAAYSVRVRADNVIRGVPIPLGYRLRSTGALLCGYYSGWIVALGVSLLLPDHFSPGAVAALFVAAGLIAVLPWGLGVRIAAGLGLIRPAPERLVRVVDGVSEQVGHRPKGVYVMTWGMVNALALVLPGWLVFTDAALAALSDQELAAVTAHEIGHLTEPKAVRRARAMGTLLPIPFAALRPVWGTWGLWGVVIVYVVFVAVVVLLRRMGRKMEVRADEAARRYEGDPGTYARALERLYEANRMPVVTGHRRLTHPDLYDRLEAAGVTPSYPRPERPPRFLATLAGLSGVVLAALLVYAVQAGPWLLLADASRSDRGLYWAAALSDPAWSLGALARRRFEQGDYGGSAVFYNGSTALDPHAVLYPANLALVLARQGRCAEGARAYSLAVERFRKGRGEHDQDWDALQGAITALSICDSDAAARKRPRP